MTTKIGSQYSIQSDGGGLRSRNDPTKGKNLKWKRIHTRESHFPKGILEIPIISEPELELRMGNFNRTKSHSEGTNRHLNDPVQTVLQSLQGNILGNVATNPSRSA
ncbi:hypothetical protein O181_031300 [Austropuccinia psidii MF-1]|uniref:Uncharacterized protein n=1 Tax=Austropuccinia psidii MF-1 TaxID=1389203 RepID=A0A9Q3CYT0_9BASI|nr:hypothetical protein [Austropuccinia psidii MF-1]